MTDATSNASNGGPARAGSPRVALVHDWLVSPGGAERVLYALHRVWPDAPIYTFSYEPEKFPEFASADVRPTRFNKMKLARTKHQLFSIPRAWTFGHTDLSNYDIVVSSCHAEAKSVKTGPNTLHVCYCHTPIRYYWSDYEWYRNNPPFGKLNPVAKWSLPVLLPALRKQDYRAAQGVDRFVANSLYVQDRIGRYYGKDAVVINPPVQADRFHLASGDGDYFLVIGRHVAYKRLDLAIDAFNELGLPLKVAGTGEEVEVQRARSKSNIEFVGRVPEDDLADVYANARALVFPQEEDFGIVPLEVMASGRPVIAFGRGGARETVIDGTTGVFFDAQTVGSLVDAVRRFETMTFDRDAIRAHAQRFDTRVFEDRMRAYVDAQYESFRAEDRRPRPERG